MGKQVEKITSRQQTTMPLKDGEQNCTSKMPNVTSETHRKLMMK